MAQVKLDIWRHKIVGDNFLIGPKYHYYFTVQTTGISATASPQLLTVHGLAFDRETGFTEAFGNDSHQLVTSVYDGLARLSSSDERVGTTYLSTSNNLTSTETFTQFSPNRGPLQITITGNAEILSTLSAGQGEVFDNDLQYSNDIYLESQNSNSVFASFLRLFGVDERDVPGLDFSSSIIPGAQRDIFDKNQQIDRPSAEDQNFCFVAGTMVDMADGTQKPIEQITIGDQVMAFDPFLNEGRGGLRASRVTQTHATPNRVVIDFHGTRVTPGHLFLCGDGPDEGDYAMLLDIIRADGAVVRADGSKVRAATNCALGSDGDRMLTVGYFIDSDDAYARQGEVRIARIRAGTRLLSDDGKDWSFLDVLAEQAFEFRDDGLVAQAGEEPHPFYYFGAPPKPEDYILKKSGFTLDQLLAEDATIGAEDGIPVPPAVRQPVNAPQTAQMQAVAKEMRRQQPKAQPRGNRQERRRQKAVQRKKYGETLH